MRMSKDARQVVRTITATRKRIENIGDKPIRNCFPYNHQVPHLSIEDLANRITEERYPLLTLFQLWNRSIIRDESLSERRCTL